MCGDVHVCTVCVCDHDYGGGKATSRAILQLKHTASASEGSLFVFVSLLPLPGTSFPICCFGCVCKTESVIGPGFKGPPDTQIWITSTH